MPPRKWPMPGDSPVARARKMALAYRAVAEQQRDVLLATAEILHKVDRRLVNFTDPAILGEIDGLATRLSAAIGLVGGLDRQFRDWGEEWHAAVPVHYDEDDYVTAKQAAPLLNLNHGTIGRLRVDGRIEGKWDPTVGSRGGWTYRVGDIWKLSTRLRGRNWRTKEPTDSITDSGRGDSK